MHVYTIYRGIKVKNNDNIIKLSNLHINSLDINQLTKNQV
jgi:hypothetical protein